MTGVRAILVTSASDAQVQAAIDDAALLAHDCIVNLSGDRQAAIVKYLAADLLIGATSGGRGVVTSESLGDASIGFASGTDFARSSYWNQALLFDPNGCIAKLGMRRATFEKV